ncbi:hypothetical protein ES703_102979 [subsurface metagenome]
MTAARIQHDISSIIMPIKTRRTFIASKNIALVGITVVRTRIITAGMFTKIIALLRANMKKHIVPMAPISLPASIKPLVKLLKPVLNCEIDFRVMAASALATTVYSKIQPTATAADSVGLKAPL